MHFRGCGNALTLYFIGANDCSTCVPKASAGRGRSPENGAPAVVNLVYLRQARGEAEAPKTGLVAVLGTAETVFGTKAPVVS